MFVIQVDKHTHGRANIPMFVHEIPDASDRQMENRKN